MSLSVVGRAALVAVVALGAGGACGGDDDDGAAATSTTAAASGTTAATASGTTAAGCDEPVVVAIADFAFEPAEPTIAPGCEVVWRNDDDQAHTSSGTGDQSWSTGNIAPGDTSAPVAFPDAGELTYRCALHPFMTAAVVVEG